MSAKTKVFIILGPTASGKTSLAVRLAQRIDGEIISADSRQVFAGMDIGSGKDLEEYGSIPYHLIDIRPAGAEYSVSDFQRDALSALSDIRHRHRVPIICGGTGHYVKSLLDDYPFTSPKTDLSLTGSLEKRSRESLYRQLKSLGLWETHHWSSDSRRRMARAIEKRLLDAAVSSPQHASFSQHYLPLCFYLQVDRRMLVERIEDRLHARLSSGLLEEVERLLSQGVDPARLERYGLEYRWIARYLTGGVAWEEMVEKLFTDIRRFAKRQMTFIRYLQKTGHAIEPITDVSSFLERAPAMLESG